MTLPAIQSLCGDNNASLPLRGRGIIARRRVCLSAAWADPPTARRERRRAVCSWAAGYGTLSEQEESPFKQDHPFLHKKGKVADNGTLLEARGRSLVSSITAAAATPAASTHASSPSASRRPFSRPTKVDLLAMPGIKTLVNHHRRRNSGGGGDGVGTDSVHFPLVASKAPSYQRNGSAIKATASMANLRKHDQHLLAALRSSSSSSSVHFEPIQPFNRLRPSPEESRFCSRCSSILTLASTSKYSLNSSTGGFVAIPDKDQDLVDGIPALLLCKLCLLEVPCKDACHLQDCNCSFCAECMRAYVEFEIAQGAYDISCPDAQCPSKGVLHEDEIKKLVGSELFEKHNKYRLNREIELDKNRTWCPRAGCETVCKLCPSQMCHPQSVHCPSCTTNFCSNCKLEWHDSLSCEQNTKKLAKEGKVEEPGISFNSDLIKCCPMCNVPIEKDEGCAQMMCKRCKHVFCWYCLASLDDDFLLRHYDKGPCKNKLGHSRASVIWHRTQVIGIFAGFGILLLVASPLLLLAAPCIVCCKCRVCNVGTNKLDNDEDVPAEEP